MFNSLTPNQIDIESARLRPEWLNANWIDHLENNEFRWNLERILEMKTPAKLFYLKDSKSDLLAFVCAIETDEFCEIICLATKPEHARKGLMRRLFQNVFENISDKKTIFLEVSEKNLVAINFYKQLGFMFLKKRAHYYSDGSAAFEFHRKGALSK